MPSERLGFIDNPLNRVHPQREDVAWIEAQRARDDARFLILAGDGALYQASPNGSDPSAFFDAGRAAGLAPDADELFLGLTPDDAPVFALSAGEIPPDPAALGVEARGMRAIAMDGAIGHDEASMLGLARSLWLWHVTHKYCAACGKPSRPTLGGYRRDCPSCGAQHFPRTDPVVIMLVTDGDRALIGRSGRFHPRMYSTIAGFMEPGETIEQAVARETVEETGLEVGDVRYVMSQPWPFPSSLMIGCFAEATTTTIAIDPNELEDAFWAGREDLAAAFRGEAEFILPPPMAIAHQLIRTYLSERDGS